MRSYRVTLLNVVEITGSNILQDLEVSSRWFAQVKKLRITYLNDTFSWSSSCSWRVRRVSCSLILHLFLGRPMFLRPFGLYCSACFGSLFVSILCTCCSHFSWYCFISFTMFCAPVFCLIHWFFSLSSFVIPSRCLKNFICAASKRCSSLFFSTQASLPNFNAALAVMLWILNVVSLFICFPKCLRIVPFILLYVCNCLLMQ